jgi:hypothetical protein
MGIGFGAMNAQQQINNLYAMARHNYAMEFGFASVQEMQENDMFVLKSVSAAANRILGKSDEEIKKIIELNYEQPYQQPQPKQQGTTLDRLKYNQQNAYKVSPFHITVIKNGEVIADIKPEDQSKNMANINRNLSRDFNVSIQREAMERANRDAYNAMLHAQAIERQYDTVGVLEFFNNGAFYEIHARDLALLQKRQRSERKKTLYDHDKFKRNIMSMYGRPVIRNKLQEERLRYRMDEADARPELIQGGYGYMPGGIPLEPGDDPRMGYCFGFNLAEGRLELQPPRTDSELAQMKNKFLTKIGIKVPLHGSDRKMM